MIRLPSDLTCTFNVMNQISEKNLISTRQASKLSGYNSDYLSRMCREGKIEGTQIGRTWLLSQESLEDFVRKQSERRQEMRSSLSESREKEYYERNTSEITPLPNLVVQTTNSEKKQIVQFKWTDFQKSGITLVATLLLLVVGLSLSQVKAFTRIGSTVLTGTFQTHNGLHDIAATALSSAHESSAKEFAANISTERKAFTIFGFTASNSDELSVAKSFVTPLLPLALEETTSTKAISNLSPEPLSSSKAFVAMSASVMSLPSDMIAAVVPVAEFAITNPTIASRDVLGTGLLAYAESGVYVYTAIQGGLNSYLDAIQSTGNDALALGTMVSNIGSESPYFLAGNEIAIAETYSRDVHDMLNGYDNGIYAWVNESPRVALAISSGTYKVGNTLATIVGNAPATIVNGYQKSSENVGNLAYGTISSSHQVVHDTAKNLAVSVGAFASSTTQNVTLTGKGALQEAVGNTNVIGAGTAQLAADIASNTSNSLRVPVVHSANEVAAVVVPASFNDFGAQFAVFLHTGVQDLFNETNTLIALLLGSSNPRLAVVPTVLTIAEPTGSKSSYSTPEYIGNTVTSTSITSSVPSSSVANSTSQYETTPTYIIEQPITNINGVSQSYVDNAISNLRGFVTEDIEASMNGQGGGGGNSGGGSISSNGANLTNGTLSDFAIASSSFNGGIISSSSFSGGPISATILTAGTSTFTGPVTTNGNLNVGGTLTANILNVANLSSDAGLIAPYIDATSTTATSTFGGDVSIGGNLNVIGNTTLGLASFTNATGTNLNLATLTATNATVGSLNIGNLNGFLKATAGAISTSLINLTADVTGILPVGNGGTGSSSYSTNGVIYGNGTNALLTTGQGGANTVLIANNGAPSFSSAITVGTSVSSPIINATNSFEINGANINTAGVLSNVAYLNQANTYSQLQTYNDGISANAISTPSLTVGSLNGLLYGSSGVVAAASVSTPLTFTGGVLGIQQANLSQSGYLASVDFNTFNNKISSSSLSGGTGISYSPSTGVIANTGVVSLTGTTNQINVSASTGSITLSLPSQLTLANASTTNFSANTLAVGGTGTTSISSTGALTTPSLTIGSLGGLLYGNSGVVLSTATSSLAVGTGLTVSGGSLGYQVGGTNATIGLAAISQGFLGNIGSASAVPTVQASSTFFTGSTGQAAYFASSGGLVGTSTITIGTNSDVGIGTTSPGSLFSVGGNDLIGGNETVTGNVTFSGLGAGFVQSSASGLLSSAALTSGQVTTALGFTPFGGTNPLPIANGGTASTSAVTNGLTYFNGSALESDNTLTWNQIQLGMNTSPWFQTNGTTYLYASSTNFATVFGIEAGGAEATTTATSYAEVAIGYKALAANTTGNQDEGLGYGALESNTAGAGNTGIGYDALASNTVGGSNVAVGDDALGSGSVGASGNTAIGTSAGLTVTGSWNAALGLDAAENGVSANTAIGYLALGSGTGGFASSTAVGYQSLDSDTTGAGNVGIGYDSLFSNTTSASSTALGSYALFKNTAADNVAVGNGALYSNTTAIGNVAVGYRALFLNTTVASSTAIGSYALYNAAGAADNVAVGGGALFGGGGVSGNNVAVGYQALTAGTAADDDTAIGSGAETGGGTVNTAVGYDALQNNGGNDYNTAVGGQAFQNGTGSGNTVLGYEALSQAGGASFNTAIGYDALFYGALGPGNVGIGANVLQANGIGSGNTAIGFDAGFNSTAASSTLIGNNTGYNITTGNDDDLLGLQAGYNLTSGSDNIVIGDNSASTTNTGSGNITIGYDISGPQAANNGSNDLDIGNLIYGTGLGAQASTTSNGNIGIGTTTPSTTFSNSGNEYIVGGLGVGSVNTTAGSIYAVGTATVGNLINKGLTANDLIYTNGSDQETSASVSSPLTFSGGTLALGTVGQANGGTGYTTYNPGDILYANGSGNLQTLPVGSSGQVLEVAAGLPSWGTVTVNGGGSGDGIFATSTGIIYPLNTANTLIVGSNATSTKNSIFEVHGQEYISTNLGIGTTSPSTNLSVQGNELLSGNLTAANITATGTVTVGTLALTSALPISSGGTGTTTAPLGQLLYGGASAYQSVGTSSITSGAGISFTGTPGALVGGTPLTITNNGVLSLAQSYGSGQTGALTLATSSALSFNGLTLGQTITNTGGTFTFTPTLSGTLSNTGLTNSSITINTAAGLTGGGTVALGSTLTLNAVSTSGLGGWNYIPGGIYNSTSTDQVMIDESATTSNAALDVGGFINTDEYHGYEQGGNLLAYASSTTGVTIFGLGAGGTDAISTGLYNDNTAIGYEALNNNAGSGNNALGYQALYSNIGGGENVANGASALYDLQNGSYNLGEGYQAGLGLISGSRNVLIGPSTISASENQVTTGSDNISIGNDVAIASSTLSNQLDIGNEIYGTGLSGTGTTTSNGNIGIGTTSPSTTFSNSGNEYIVGGLGVGSVNTTAGSIYAVGTATVGNLINNGLTTSDLIYTNASDQETSVGTSSLAVGTGLTVSGGSLGYQVGGTSATIALASIPNGDVLANGTGASAAPTAVATSTLYGTGTGGQILAWNNGVPQWVGTSTIAGTNYFTNSGASTYLSTGYNLGIGTTTPFSSLSVSTTTASAGTYSLFAVASNTNATLFNVLGNGDVGIGTTSPSTTFSNSGNEYIVGGLGIGSVNTTAGSIYATGNATVGNLINNGLTTGDLIYTNGSDQETSASVSLPLTFTSGTLAINQAGSLSSGYLSSTNWNTFNNKQNAITPGTGLSFTGNTLNSIFTLSGNNIYNNSGTNLGIGTTSPGQTLGIQGNGLFAGNLQSTNLTATGTATVGNLINNGLTTSDLIYTNASDQETSVGTSSLAVGTGLTVSGGSLGYQVGGTSATIALASIPNGDVLANGTGASAAPTAVATSTLYGTGTGGQILAWNNGVPQWVGTTTAGTGLTYNQGSPGNFSVNTSQNISTLSNLTSNGFVITTGGTGALSIQASPITLAEGGTNATSFTTSGNAVYYNGTSLVTAPTNSAVTIPYASTTAFSAANGNISGTLGIGTTSPYAALSIFAGGNYAGLAPATLFAVGSSSAGNATSTLFNVLSSGNVGIGTTSPSTTFSNSGNEYIVGGLGVGSVNTTAGSIYATGNATVGNLINNGLTAGDLIYTNNSNQETSATVSLPLTFSAGGALAINQAGSLGSGYLSSTDWNTFNNKQNAITPGTGLSFSGNTLNNTGVTSIATGNGITGGTITTTGTIGLATINAGVLGAVTSGSVPTSQATSTLYGLGINGYVLSEVGGTPTWVATTTLSTISGTLNLSNQVSNTLGVGNGGTGNSSVADGALLFGGPTGGTTALTALATSTAGDFLQLSATTGRPNWAATLGIANGGTATATAVTNGVYYNNGSSAEADNTLTWNQIQLGMNTSPWFQTLGKTFVYASTTNQDTVLGLNAGGNNATTTATVENETAIGYGALESDTTSLGATAVGTGALNSDTSGNYETAVGYDALNNNTTGGGDSAFGYDALFTSANANSASDTAVGAFAGYKANEGTSGGSTFVGNGAAFNSTGGVNNDAFGYRALYKNAGNSSSTAIGSFALYNNTAADNVALGGGALFTNTTGSGETALGYQALNLSTGASNTAIGNSALLDNAAGASNTAIGFEAGQGLTTGSDNVAIGANTFASGNAAGAANDTAVGYQSQTDTYGEATGNTSLGWEALAAGNNANNTAIGSGAISFAGISKQPGPGNTAVGFDALYNAGNAASQTESSSTAVGGFAGYNLTSGSDDNLFGTAAGYSLTTGSNNIIMGDYTASTSDVAGSNNIYIGYDISGNGAPTDSSDNLDIGNLIYGTGLGAQASTTSTGSVGIGTTSPYATFSVFAGGNYAALAPATLFAVGSSSAGNATSTLFNVLSSGNVGIGTTSPESKLTVTGAACISTGNVGANACVNTPGNISYTTANTAGYDVAEDYGSVNASSTVPGTIVALDTQVAGESIETAMQGQTILGVVSTAPGMVLGGSHGGALKLYQVPVALSGRIPVNVDMEGGPISVGDRIALSSTPGVGMKATQSAETVGIALQSASAPGEIDVFAEPQYYFNPGQLSLDSTDDGVTIGSGSNSSNSNNLKVNGSAIVNGNTSASSFEEANAGAAFTNEFGDVTLGSTTASSVLSADGTGVDVYKLATFTLTGVQQLVASTQTLSGEINSLAAQTSELTNTTNELSSTTIGVSAQVVSLSARVSALEAAATASMTEATSTAPSSLLSTTTAAVEDALSGLGALIGNGIAQFDTLVVHNLVFSKSNDGTSAAGSGTVLAGNTVAEIDNPNMTTSSEVSITFTAPVQGSWYVSDKENGKFKITLSQVQTQDVTFDYFIVQTEGQMATSTADTTASGGFAAWLANLFGTPTTPSTPPSSDTASSTDSSSGNSTGSTDTTASSTPPGSGATASSTPSTSSPTIELVGNAAISLTVGDIFTDPGATAQDSSGNDISSSITESGSVDTGTPGIYTLVYSVTDSSGQSTSVSRVVTVSPAYQATGGGSGSSSSSSSGATSSGTTSDTSSGSSASGSSSSSSDSGSSTDSSGSSTGSSAPTSSSSSSSSGSSSSGTTTGQ